MTKKPIVTEEMLERETMKAVVETFGQMKPEALFGMLVGQRMSFNITFEGTPLQVDVKFLQGEVQARIRIAKPEEPKEKTEDGNRTETD